MADADREVVFRLTAEVDPAAGAAVKKLADGMAKAQKGINKGSDDGAKKQGDNAKKAADDAMRIQDRLKVLRNQAANHAEKIQINLQRIQGLAAKQYLKNEETRRKAEKKNADDKKRGLEEAARHEKALQEKSDRNLIAGKLRVSEAFESGAEAIMRFSRGFVMLGLVGEENMEKMVRGLVKMQAAVDIVLGGVKLIIRADRMMQGIRTIIYAEQLAAQAAEAGGRTANIALIEAETTALAGKAAAGAAAGAAEGVAATASGAARRSSGVIGGITAWEVGKYAVKKGAGAASAAASAAAPIALFAAKAAAGGLILHEALTGLARALGSTSEHAESFSLAVKGLVKASKDAAESAKRVARISAQQSADRTIAELATRRTRLAWGPRSKIDAAQRENVLASVRAAAMAAPEGERDLTVANQIEINARQERFARNLALNQQRQATASAVAGGSLPAVAQEREMERGFRQEAIAASERLIAAAKERASIERASAQERIDNQNVIIQKTEDEIKLRKDAIKSERNQMLSAKQRFGAMTDAEQQRVIDIHRRAQAGGSISLEEAGILKSVQTRSTEEITGKFYGERAERGRFAELAAANMAKIAKDQAIVTALDVTLKGQREVRVTFEEDAEKVAAEIAARISEVTEEKNALIVESLQELYEEDRVKIRVELEEFLQTIQTGEFAKQHALAGIT